MRTTKQQNRLSLLLKNKIKNVYFLETLPSVKKMVSLCGSIFVVCDQKLKSKIWRKYEGVYFVKAGEKLKDVDHFSFHTKNILKRISRMPQPPSSFIGIGGGSVTDFTGFFSSVYKRGVPVYYIPTTLLSAMDACHGGKTALNVSSVKNVLGTYHFPEEVWIVKNLIRNVKSSEIFSAYGELIKIALLQNVSLYQKLKKKPKPSFDHLWSMLPSAIKSKLDIVSKDPFEKKNIRRCLNLGHTLGHCLESYHKIPHGRAVAMGTLFALHWSMKNKFISSSLFSEMQDLIKHYTKVSSVLKIPPLQLKKLLDQDKKNISSNKMEFIFIKGAGKPFIKAVSTEDIIRFYKKYYL